MYSDKKRNHNKTFLAGAERGGKESPAFYISTPLYANHERKRFVGFCFSNVVIDDFSITHRALLLDLLQNNIFIMN